MILAAPLASAGEATAATAKAAAMMATVAVLLAFEVNGVDSSLGPLRWRDGAGTPLHAAAIVAARQNDQGFPSVLFLHQRVGGQKDRVVQGCSAAVMPSMAAISPISGIAAIAVLIVPGFIRGSCSHLVQRIVQLGTGTSEILQQLRFMGELDQESLIGRTIHRRSHHLIQKRFAGGPFVLECTPHRPADIDEKPKCQRQIVVLVEVPDSLRMAIDAQRKL